MESAESTRVIPDMKRSCDRVYQFSAQASRKKITGRMTMYPEGIGVPSVFFLARAETPSRATEDAVSNPTSDHLAIEDSIYEF
jgi:hypothetical protein